MLDYIPKPNDVKAQKVVDALRVIQNQRIQHDNAVKECTHFIIPRKSDIRKMETIGSTYTELKPYINLFTRAGRSACQKMASGIFSYMTPKNQKWFKATMGNRELDENLNVYKWFDHVRDVMLDFLSRSNFTEISHETYLNMGAIGTVCTQVEWDKEEDGLIFQDYPYNTFYFTEDNNHKPNRVYREFTYTAEQAVKEWGEEALKHCKTVMKCYNSKDEAERRQQLKFIHLVEPNRNRNPRKIDKFNKAFKSTFICEDDLQIIKEGGFDTQPYIVARFLRYNTEGNVMGYSPAMDCMPIIKTLEQLRKKFLFAVEKNLNPAMARGVTMGMVPNKVRTTPNSISNFDSRNPESKPTPILQQIDLSYTLQELEAEVKEIEDAFYIPSFQTITNIDKSNATATEIIARQNEALINISPAIARLEDEWLDPLLSQVFTLLQAKGKFEPPPVELKNNTEFRLEFTGVLSSAPKIAESISISNYFQELAPLLEFMPEDTRAEVINSHNFYEITKTLQENRNLPARFRKTPQEIEEETAKQQQAMQQAMQQQQMTELAKSQDLSKKPQDGSPMEAIV